MKTLGLKHAGMIAAAMCFAVLAIGLTAALLSMPRIGETADADAAYTDAGAFELSNLRYTPEESTASAEGGADGVTEAATPEELTGRVALLRTVRGQLGSEGQIIGGDGSLYYTQWYIGGEYSNGWDEDTPWCGAFVSWAAAQIAEHLDGFTPFASVETGLTLFTDETNGAWRDGGEKPLPGDLVFFDWDEEGSEDHGAPDHVGVVTRRDAATLYTIEGNCDGRVSACRYDIDDPRIMGFGALNWK